MVQPLAPEQWDLLDALWQGLPLPEPEEPPATEPAPAPELEEPAPVSDDTPTIPDTPTVRASGAGNKVDFVGYAAKLIEGLRFLRHTAANARADRLEALMLTIDSWRGDHQPTNEVRARTMYDFGVEANCAQVMIRGER